MKKPKRRRDPEILHGNHARMDPNTEVDSVFLTQPLSNVKLYRNQLGLIPEPDVEMERNWSQENML